ncbi:hypothetical protein OJF2_55270 [Aquisphaera giovannonii]|uniref:DUF2127 domain-containing protein n=1 Tax=Aquisphaera giovannonii TaxID=406548 RepID=A0A5B9W8I6_9BACT|nr:DUF2127 domain-containing protein [Aquisphaera giovannonii]QEH36942.1 hypothetical protein OJF2_55270 [Aquisphaera giovannonii]
MSEKEHPTSGRIPVGFIVIGIYKVATAVLALSLAIGLMRLYQGDARASLERLVRGVGLDPEDSIVHPLLLRLAELERRQLYGVLAGMAGYAALRVVEGVAILRGRRWGEFLIVVSSVSLLPLEVWEIARHGGPIRVGALALNLAIVAYLVGRLGREGGVFRSTRSTTRGQSGSEPRNVRP